jgi:hypothetical protein
MQVGPAQGAGALPSVDMPFSVSLQLAQQWHRKHKMTSQAPHGLQFALQCRGWLLCAADKHLELSGQMCRPNTPLYCWQQVLWCCYRATLRRLHWRPSTARVRPSWSSQTAPTWHVPAHPGEQHVDLDIAACHEPVHLLVSSCHCVLYLLHVIQGLCCHTCQG